MVKTSIIIQEEPIEGIELNCPDKDTGAKVVFVGNCRSENGKINALELEHYAPMAQKQLNKIADIACENWTIKQLLICHRFGKIYPGEEIVKVIAMSRSRQEAFNAVQFIMDFLKTDAPFWKKQIFTDKTDHEWVSSLDKDKKAKEKWQNF